jgi:hypothetical protein
MPTSGAPTPRIGAAGQLDRPGGPCVSLSDLLRSERAALVLELARIDASLAGAAIAGF